MKLLNLRKELKDVALKQKIDVVDVDFIIAEVLKVERTELALIDNVTKFDEKKIRKCFKNRLKGKPVDAIFKNIYFYGNKFEVNKNVLTPRQDSEHLIDVALKYITENSKVLDLCTGSGCLAVTLSLEKNIPVVATDISKRALKIAKRNAKANCADVKFIWSNLFNKVDGEFDVVVSNPPYIPSKEIFLLDKEVKNFDPALALDGGSDGLKFYRRIHDEVGNKLKKDGIIIFEIGEEQAEDIKQIFADYKHIETQKDYNGIERILVFKK